MSKYFILNNDNSNYIGKDGKVYIDEKEAITFFWDDKDKKISIQDMGTYSIEQVCINNCNNNGKCIKSKCECDKGWDGEDCSNKTGGDDDGGNSSGTNTTTIILLVVLFIFFAIPFIFILNHLRKKQK